jgi:hypothetical protein
MHTVDEAGVRWVLDVALRMPQLAGIRDIGRRSA